MPWDVDPKYVTVTEPDVFSLEGLAAWLRTQPPEMKYNYFNIVDCLLCRYGRARGLAVHSAGGDNIAVYGGSPRRITRHTIPGSWSVINPGPWTYAAALARAEALLEARHA